MTTRAPGSLDLIIEKQQGQWDYQQTASMSIAIIKRCHHEHSRQLPRRPWRWSTDIKCYYSGTWRRLKPLIWGEGPPIGLYGTAVVQGLSSPWARWHSGTRDGMGAKKTDPLQQVLVLVLVNNRLRNTQIAIGVGSVGGPLYHACLGAQDPRV